MSLLFDLALEFGLSRSELNRIVSSAPARYKTYQIPKRRGGTRTISQPARELKALQRYLLYGMLSKFPIHDIAMAYVKDRGIADNARRHVGADVILKLDFVDFFPSIVPKDLERANRTTHPHPIPFLDLEIVYQLVFWGRGTPLPRCLSIGAPTSPVVSNIVMFQLDTQIAAIADECGVVVTRYADDITVSGAQEGQVARFERRFEKLVEGWQSPNLRLNNKKRGLYRRGERQMVTGLVLTPNGAISIGRQRKRLISALIHNFKAGKLSPIDTMRAKGYLGFSIAVEPDFVTTMRQRYGDGVIDAILSAEAPEAMTLRDLILEI